VPLFALMAAASVSAWPTSYLVPVLVVLIYTVVMICYDDFVFHRRCGRFEAFTHRLLTCGNGLAFLAWAHWCFVRQGGVL
jgi:Na+/glutamate symporter